MSSWASSFWSTTRLVCPSVNLSVDRVPHTSLPSVARNRLNQCQFLSRTAWSNQLERVLVDLRAAPEQRLDDHLGNLTIAVAVEVDPVDGQRRRCSMVRALATDRTGRRTARPCRPRRPPWPRSRPRGASCCHDHPADSDCSGSRGRSAKTRRRTVPVVSKNTNELKTGDLAMPAQEEPSSRSSGFSPSPRIVLEICCLRPPSATPKGAELSLFGEPTKVNISLGREYGPRHRSKPRDQRWIDFLGSTGCRWPCWWSMDGTGSEDSTLGPDDCKAHGPWPCRKHRH